MVSNRHKDTVRWKALALEYEMKIRYLERALAQEESKLRIAEQASSAFFSRDSSHPRCLSDECIPDVRESLL